MRHAVRGGHREVERRGVGDAGAVDVGGLPAGARGELFDLEPRARERAPRRCLRLRKSAMSRRRLLGSRRRRRPRRGDDEHLVPEVRDVSQDLAEVGQLLHGPVWGPWSIVRSGLRRMSVAAVARLVTIFNTVTRLWGYGHRRTDRGHMPEKVVIIGSGPAGWTAAIYAARANLQPLVFEGDATSEKNAVQGTLPLGQFEPYHGRKLPELARGRYPPVLEVASEDRRPYWVTADKPQPTHGINGPELMELMRQQAVQFRTRVETKDIVTLDANMPLSS